MLSLLTLQPRHIALIVVAAGLALGCERAGPAGPTAPSSRAPAVPNLIGRVLQSSTHEPPPSGGVVYLEDAPKQPGVATTATIDFHHKAFTPFISVITTGGTVTFGNKDALTHHVFSPDVKGWDTGYLAQAQTNTRQFDTPGVISLLCNIHPEMLGYLLVIPSTYYGLFGVDGRWVIADVPPGVYKATAWSPRLPTVTKSVTVGPTGVVSADFELSPAGTTN